MKRLIATAALLLMLPALASAQNTDHQYRGHGYLFLGLGTGIGGCCPGVLGGRGYYPVVVQGGFGGEGFLHKRMGLGGEAEYANWGGDFRSAWIGSVDGSYHFRCRAARGGVDPFVLGGFSLYGPTSGEGGTGQLGGNVGGGVNLWLAEHTTLRFEVRDHVHGESYLPGNTAFSAISFRVRLTFR